MCLKTPQWYSSCLCNFDVRTTPCDVALERSWACRETYYGPSEFVAGPEGEGWCSKHREEEDLEENGESEEGDEVKKNTTAAAEVKNPEQIDDAANGAAVLGKSEPSTMEVEKDVAESSKPEPTDDAEKYPAALSEPERAVTEKVSKWFWSTPE